MRWVWWSFTIKLRRQVVKTCTIRVFLCNSTSIIFIRSQNCSSPAEKRPAHWCSKSWNGFYTNRSQSSAYSNWVVVIQWPESKNTNSLSRTNLCSASKVYFNFWKWICINLHLNFVKPIVAVRSRLKKRRITPSSQGLESSWPMRLILMED